MTGIIAFELIREMITMYEQIYDLKIMIGERK